MVVKFTLFTVLKKKHKNKFELGIIKGAWVKGNLMPRFQDLKRIGFQKVCDINKLSDIKNTKEFINLKAFVEFKRRESGTYKEIPENFIYNMIKHELSIEKAFINYKQSIMEFKMEGK